MIATIAIFLEYTTPYNITTAGKGMRFLVGGTIGGVYKSNRIDYQEVSVAAAKKYMGTISVRTTDINTMTFSLDFYVVDNATGAQSRSNFPFSSTYESQLKEMITYAQAKPVGSTASISRTWGTSTTSQFVLTYQTFFDLVVGIPQEMPTADEPMFLGKCYFKTGNSTITQPNTPNAAYTEIELTNPALSVNCYFTSNIDFPSFGVKIPLYISQSQTLTMLRNQGGYIKPGSFNFITVQSIFNGWKQVATGQEFLELAEKCIANGTQFETKEVTHNQTSGQTVTGFITLVYEIYYVNSPIAPVIDDPDKGLQYDLNREQEEVTEFIEDLMQIERQLFSITMPPRTFNEIIETNRTPITQDIPSDIVNSTLQDFSHIANDRDFQTFINDQSKSDAPYKVKKLASEAVNRYRNDPQAQSWINQNFGSFDQFETHISQLPLRERLSYLFGGKTLVNTKKKQIPVGAVSLPLLGQLYNDLYPNDKYLVDQSKQSEFLQPIKDMLYDVYNFQIGPQGVQARYEPRREPVQDEEGVLYWGTANQAKAGYQPTYDKYSNYKNAHDSTYDKTYTQQYDTPKPQQKQKTKQVKQKQVKYEQQEQQQKTEEQNVKQQQQQKMNQQKQRQFNTNKQFYMPDDNIFAEERRQQKTRNPFKALGALASNYLWGKGEQVVNNVVNKAETKMYEATNRVASDIAAKVEQAFDDPVRYTVEAVEAWNELTSNNKPLTNLEKDIMASYLNDGILISTEEVAQIAKQIVRERSGDFSGDPEQSYIDARKVMQQFEDNRLKRLRTAEANALSLAGGPREYDNNDYIFGLDQFEDILRKKIQREGYQAVAELDINLEQPKITKALKAKVDQLEHLVKLQNEGIPQPLPELGWWEKIDNVKERFQQAIAPKQKQYIENQLGQIFDEDPKEPYDSKHIKRDAFTRGRIQRHMERELAEKRFEKLMKIGQMITRGLPRSNNIIYNLDTRPILGKRLRNRF